MEKNVQSVNYSFQNLIFIRILRKTMDIDLLANVVQINFIMVIRIEDLTIIKTYIKNNRSKINAYEKERRKSDSNFNLHCSIRQRLIEHSNLREKKDKLIGCSNYYLRKWTIYQLYGDMTEEK